MQRDVGLITSIVFKRPAEHADVQIDGGEVPGVEVPVRLDHLFFLIRNCLNRLSLPGPWAMAGLVVQGTAIQLAQRRARTNGQSSTQPSIETTLCWNPCSAT